MVDGFFAWIPGSFSETQITGDFKRGALYSGKLNTLVGRPLIQIHREPKQP
jgi:hypothetical protein